MLESRSMYASKGNLWETDADCRQDGKERRLRARASTLLVEGADADDPEKQAYQPCEGASTRGQGTRQRTKSRQSRLRC